MCVGKGIRTERGEEEEEDDLNEIWISVKYKLWDHVNKRKYFILYSPFLKRFCKSLVCSYRVIDREISEIFACLSFSRWQSQYMFLAKRASFGRTETKIAASAAVGVGLQSFDISRCCSRCFPRSPLIVFHLVKDLRHIARQCR